MTTWFVSRHPGAIEWAARYGIDADRWVKHLNPLDVAAGDTVIGTLPVQLAAMVCQRGGRYLHLALDIPAEWRGKELSAAELVAVKTGLKEFFVSEA